MNTTSIRLLLPSTIIAVLMGFSGEAAAQSGLDACGNIWVEAKADCEIEPPGVTCKTKCEPIRFEASCAAELAVSCQGNCTVDITTELPVCQSTCETQCQQDPPKFECSTSCELRCGAGCSAKCSGGDKAAHCQASCEASCAFNCDTECRELPPTSTCATICERSCTGSLKAELTVDCQASCQAQGFASCEAKLKGGCETACDTKDGALFCDGQFVDHGGNLQTCIDALKNLDISVDAEAKVSVGCSVHPDDTPPFWALTSLALLPFFWRRRRR